MGRKTAGLSLGSMLALALTAAVIVGCVCFFSTVLGDAGQASMRAERVAGLIDDVLHASTEVPTPQATVRPELVTPPPPASSGSGNN